MALSRIVTGKPANTESMRQFVDGSTRSYAILRSASIGLGVYQPGWRWSKHVKPETGQPSENHIGYVISGSMMVMDPDGETKEIGPGVAFEIRANSDAWVLGEAPCTALDFIPIPGLNPNDA